MARQKLSKTLRGKSTSSLSGRSERMTPAEIKAAKFESKAAADVKQPAMGTPGATAEAADVKSTSSVSMQRKPRREVTGITALGREYDGLTPNAKRGERAKGTKSKYYPVFKQRGMTSPRVQKKAGGGKAIPQGDKGKGIRALVASGPKGKKAAKEMGFAVAKKGGKIVTAMTGGQIVSMMYDD